MTADEHRAEGFDALDLGANTVAIAHFLAAEAREVEREQRRAAKAAADAFRQLDAEFDRYLNDLAPKHDSDLPEEMVP